MSLRYLLLLILQQVQSQEKLTCDDLSKKAPFKYQKLLGDWNSVFAYKEDYFQYDCRRLKISNITVADIEYLKSLMGDNSTRGPVGWKTLKLRVQIYKNNNLDHDFALQETKFPGRMYGARIPHFFMNPDMFGQIRVSIQMNVVQDYLVTVSCRYHDVNVYARGAPHVTRVQRFLDTLDIPESSGRPVCVPGTIEAPEPTVNERSLNETDVKDNKYKTINVEL